MNDLSQWLSDTEHVLADGTGPNGELDVQRARAQQQVRRGVIGHGEITFSTAILNIIMGYPTIGYVTLIL